LAALAQALREAALASSADGKIAARPPAVYGPAWGAWRTYGLPLNIPEPARPQDARGVSRPLSPLILPLALIPPGAEAPAPGAEAPAVAFRAAAVANLIFQALPLAGGGYYYQWETGKPRWLRGG
jgi:hypothetical protein